MNIFKTKIIIITKKILKVIINFNITYDMKIFVLPDTLTFNNLHYEQ